MKWNSAVDEPTVQVLLADGAFLPDYCTDGSAGADLRAMLVNSITLEPGCRALVPTGVSIQLPAGYEAQVRSRSGMAAKHGIACLNAPGTVDSDYRGQIQVILINHGDESYLISNGDRIAQLVVAPVSRAHFIKSAILEHTHRGEGGFGSTGR